jgi:exopolyphosphatase/guanosine-5'-triphosphate,3'-diphosphate pyrophosphatase
MPDNTELIIDVGTNSILALNVKIGDGGLSVISDTKVTTRLGEGLQNSGLLSREAMKRTVSAISGILSGSEVDSVTVIGTEAVRKAENKREFINLLKSECSLDLMVIAGETEAALSYFGAFYNLDVDKSDVLLVDMGGGSTELIFGSGDKIMDILSVPIGAMRLKDATTTDSLKEYRSFAEIVFAKELAEFNKKSPGTFLATGGTITSAGAIYKKMTEFSASDVHGLRLTANMLNEIGRNFEDISPDRRKSLIPFDPERADLMLPGLGIFLALLSIFKKDEITVSNGGLRYGAALRAELVVSC